MNSTSTESLPVNSGIRPGSDRSTKKFYGSNSSTDQMENNLFFSTTSRRFL